MPDQEKLKVVYLINELGKGGSERQLYLLLTHMNLNQVEPLVVVFNPSTLTSYQAPLQAAGIRVIEIPPDKNTILKRLVYLARLLRQERPQVVHSWSVHDNPYASLAGWAARVPLRAGSMRDSINNQGFQSLSRLQKQLTTQSNPLIFVNAHSIQHDLLNIKVPARKIILLENCAEIMSSSNGTIFDLFGLPKNLKRHKVIGTICNIRKKKNIHIFVQGLAQVMQEVDDLVGVVIGQPIPDELDYFQNIKNLIVHLGVEGQIFLLGFRDDAPSLMHHLDVFCLLSEFEGTPNAILEAMVAGVPVIATQVGGIPGLVEHGVTGLLVPPQDVTAFQSALRQLLVNPHKAAEMGAAGRQVIQSGYSCNRRADELLTIYRELLQERR